MTRFDSISRRTALTQMAGSAMLAGIPGARALAQTTAYNPATEPLQLGALAAKKGLLFGSPFSPWLWNMNQITTNWSTVPYVQLFQRQCTMATIIYQWNAMEPVQGQVNTTYTDIALNYWVAKGLKARVHTLVWYETLPAWFAALPSATAAIDALQNHVSGLVSHLKGKVYAYDVVNEGINQFDGLPYGLRACPLTTLIGTGWMEYAFKAARAADPNALLTYNEYHSESTGTAEYDGRRTAILALVDRFQKNNVPIDAIGLQSHLWDINYWNAFDPKSFSKYLAELSARGIQIFLTELDTMDNSLPANITQRDAGVAEMYKIYLETALANPAVKAIDSWGLVDSESVEAENPQFFRADGLPPRPLLFDNNLMPKLSAQTVASVLSSVPSR